MEAAKRKPYPSDLTDAQWQIIEPLLPASSGAGRPRKTNLREIVNAIFYLLRTGCSWSSLPRDFPPEGTVRDYFHQWRKSGLWERINAALRERLRREAGREAQPSAAILDSQSVKTTRTAGARGYDAGKKSTERNGIWSLTCWGWCFP
jgi:putative transposase